MTTSGAALTCVVPSCGPDPSLIAAWGRLVELHFVREVVVVCPHGAATPAAPRPAGVRIVDAPLGRASQMNAGAAEARSDFVFFVHGDTRVGADALAAVVRTLRAHPDDTLALSLRFDSRLLGLRVLEWMSRVRNHVFPFPLGDQGLAMRRARFLELGGFPDEPLFEDVVMSRAMRRTGAVRVLPQIALTDAGRFERGGVFRHLAHNLFLFTAYLLGASPRALVRRYYGREYFERWLAADPGRRERNAVRAPAPSPSS